MANPEMLKTENGDARLIEAVKKGDHALAKKLLDEGADIHQRGEQDWTPLNFAAGKGDLEMVKLLVGRGADITVTGRDNRRPSAIARAASRTEVLAFLSAKEKELGVWEDPLKLHPYCKAYYLRDLRRFKNWSEERKNWKVNKYWSDDIKADFEKAYEDNDVVFVHDNLTVTKSMWRNEHIVFDNVGPEWEEFCRNELGFRIPDELL